jgi:5'-3' exonuclease
MGIKGLRQLLKKKIQQLEVIVDISYFSGKHIAIDANFFLFKYKAAHKNLFVEQSLKFVRLLTEHNISLSFVFDGESPVEKTNEKEKRNQKRKIYVEKVERLEYCLDHYEKTKTILPELLNINKNPNVPFSFYNAKLHVAKMKTCILNISIDDYKNFKDMLTKEKISIITAQGEAEVLCSEMVKNNKAAGVFTQDTDVLACCVPVMITELNSYTKKFTVVYLENILKQLELDKQSWLDFCIMCGTDFNSNIENIGPVKSLNLIKKYKTIEEINKNEKKSFLKKHEKDLVKY